MRFDRLLWDLNVIFTEDSVDRIMIKAILKNRASEVAEEVRERVVALMLEKKLDEASAPI